MFPFYGKSLVFVLKSYKKQFCQQAQYNQKQLRRINNNNNRDTFYQCSFHSTQTLDKTFLNSDENTFKSNQQ